MSDLARLLQHYYGDQPNALAQYGETSDTSNVLAGMPKPNALADALRVAGAPPKDEHGFLFSRVGGDLKFNPYEAVKNFMGYRAPPGALSTSGDDAPIRNAMDAAGWVGMSGLGLNAFGAVPANALGSAGAKAPQALAEALNVASPPRVENPIKGFHGSPHEFKPEPGHPIGRFNSEKIGTGEGLQEFGYGHYIAENENTAQGYKRPIWANEHEAPPGHMYEVAIHAPRDRFLNWDAPLSAQSDAVREALAKIDGFRVLDKDLRVMRGSDYALYERPQDALVARFGSPEAASAELSKVGIPGARHVDEAPHSNYVVFPGNEGLIEILRKYGLLGPVAAGATANALMGDKDSQ